MLSISVCTVVGLVCGAVIGFYLFVVFFHFAVGSSPSRSMGGLVDRLWLALIASIIASLCGGGVCGYLAYREAFKD